MVCDELPPAPNDSFGSIAAYHGYTESVVTLLEQSEGLSVYHRFFF